MVERLLCKLDSCKRWFQAAKVQNTLRGSKGTSKQKQKMPEDGTDKTRGGLLHVRLFPCTTILHGPIATNKAWRPHKTQSETPPGSGAKQNYTLSPAMLARRLWAVYGSYTGRSGGPPNHTFCKPLAAPLPDQYTKKKHECLNIIYWPLP